MATAADMTAAYLKQLTAHGETVTVTRGETSTSALGRLLSAANDELTDSIDQTGVKAVVMASLSFAPEEGDKVTAAGRSFRITHVDDITRRVAGTLIAYTLTLAG